jgi:hypothetical protein
MTDMEQCFGHHLANVNRQRPVCPHTPETLAAPAGTRIPAGQFSTPPDVFLGTYRFITHANKY